MQFHGGLTDFTVRSDTMHTIFGGGRKDLEFPMFLLVDNAQVTFQNLVFTDGLALDGGSVMTVYPMATATLRTCAVSLNYGTAIFIYMAHLLTFETNFTTNYSPSSAGAVQVTAGSAEFEDTLFDGNEAGAGAGGAAGAGAGGAGSGAAGSTFCSG